LQWAKGDPGSRPAAGERSTDVLTQLGSHNWLQQAAPGGTGGGGGQIRLGALSRRQGATALQQTDAAAGDAEHAADDALAGKSLFWHCSLRLK
jgi:hypothetical protein